jgi:hypothetical protein
MPNVPITSKKEDEEMATVRIYPDCNTDSSAKLSEKYMKNLNIHMYISTKVAFLTEPKRNKSK